MAQEAVEPAGDGSVIVVAATGVAEDIETTGKAITVLDELEIESVQGGDIARVLQRVPGVTLNRNGGVGSTSAVRIRGSSNDQVLTLIDGVRVADPSSIANGYDFTNLLPGNVERIEVLRGTNSTIWGSSAVGGVVLVTTARPRTGGSVSVEYGSRDTLYLSGDAGYAGDRFGITAYGSLYDTEGFSALAAGTEKDGFRQEAFGANGYAALSDSLTLRASVRHADSLVDIDNFGDTADTQDTDQTSLSVSAEAMVDNVEIVASYSFAKTDRVSTSIFGPFIADGSLNRVDLRTRAPVAAGVTLHSGGYFEWTDYRTNFGGDDKLERRGAYAQLDYDAGPLHLAAGARLDDGTLFGSEVTLGADASYRFSETVRARASFGQGYKAPSLFQLYDAFSGNPALTPEESTNFDFGLDFGERGGMAFGAVTLFYRDIENQIDFDPGTFVYFNTGQARAQGVEVEAGFNPVPRLGLQAVYTFLDTENRSGANAGNALGRRPRHSATLAADWTTPLAGLVLGADLRIVGSSFDNDANTVRLDGYEVLDLRVSLPVGSIFEVFGRVENVWDEDYQTAAGFNTAGRGVFGGVRARF
ncbi:TonB-dependent receptor plug domain-containing protein [Paraurantiacibacter namhicola]|nr:TonB-dependent receptor [Paraurantiacibacter namhicola]